MKLVITTPRPRNPLVAVSRLRRAGSHRSGAKTQRQQARHALRRELFRTGAEHHGP